MTSDNRGIKIAEQNLNSLKGDWIRRTAQQKVVVKPPKPKKVPKYKIFAEDFRGLEKGYFVEYHYATNNQATSARSMLTRATEWLGWNKDEPTNSMSYRSQVYYNVQLDEHVLRVERLEHSKPKKNYSS